VAQAASVTAGMARLQVRCNNLPSAHLLQPLPQPGSGPSEQTMSEGWFRRELWDYQVKGAG